jgi:ABC-type transport system involved in cytochrome c biogenesis ATPase subunit
MLDQSKRLASITVTGFQSYWHPETVEFDPELTLIAGRNDVGKSALLRALRVLAVESEGVRADFEITYRWIVPTSRLVLVGPDVAAHEHPSWLERHEEHTLAVTFRLRNAPGDRGQIQPGQVGHTAVEFVELGFRAESANPEEQAGWSGGPFNGTATLVGEFASLVRSACSEIAYLGPRRFQPGTRASIAAPVLTPTGVNLTEVVFHLQTNELRTGFQALQDFLQSAFPQLSVVTARTLPNEQTMELHAAYLGAEDRHIPISECGTGIEQMLALGAAVLTNPSPRVFLIDEPQAYLHPHAERSLQQFLEAHSQHQYVIATHSSVLLNSRPLSQTRLITMENGATAVAVPADVASVLDELGVTAADLGQAERVLWVEGPSEVEIIEGLLASSGLSPQTLRVRAMPTASRFSARGRRGAEQTFAFLRSVVEAIAALPVTMLFLFDSDEKSSSVREAIRDASGGRARFLPVREIENLLLDPISIHELLMQRSEQFGLNAPTTEDVQLALQEELDKHDDRKLYPQGLNEGETSDDRVVGSEVLDRLYERFLSAQYSKVRDGKELSALVEANEPERLLPLHNLLAELTQPG